MLTVLCLATAPTKYGHTCETKYCFVFPPEIIVDTCKHKDEMEEGNTDNSFLTSESESIFGKMCEVLVKEKTG